MIVTMISDGELSTHRNKPLVFLNATIQTPNQPLRDQSQVHGQSQWRVSIAHGPEHTAKLFFITITDEREFFESSQTWTSWRKF